MTKRVKEYIKQIDVLIRTEDKNINYEEEVKKHLVQISFFQHERLIHLLVTILFAILTIAIFLYNMALPSIGMFILNLAFIILLIPYIKHYFFLENSVQYMYKQYDMLLKKCRNFYKI